MVLEEISVEEVFLLPFLSTNVQGMRLHPVSIKLKFPNPFSVHALVCVSGVRLVLLEIGT